MSSKFAPTKFKKKAPAWCLPGMFPKPQEFAANYPSFLHCFAFWRDAALAPPVSFAESFRLTLADPPYHWSGESAPNGLRLRVQIALAPDPDTFDFHLSLLRNDHLLDDDSWHNVQLQTNLPWRSPLLEHLHNPPLDMNGLQVLG